MIERPLRDAQGRFQRGDDLGAAGMTNEATYLVHPDFGTLQYSGDGRSHMGLGKRWDRLRKNDFEALAIQIPTHDVERVGPGMLAGGLHFRDAILSGAQDTGGGSVAK